MCAVTSESPVGLVYPGGRKEVVQNVTHQGKAIDMHGHPLSAGRCLF